MTNPDSFIDEDKKKHPENYLVHWTTQVEHTVTALLQGFEGDHEAGRVFLRKLVELSKESGHRAAARTVVPCGRRLMDIPGWEQLDPQVAYDFFFKYVDAMIPLSTFVSENCDAEVALMIGAIHEFCHQVWHKHPVFVDDETYG